MGYMASVGFVKYKITGPKPPKDCDVWWRADDRRYANYDPFAEFEQPSGSHLVIEFTPYILVSTTAKGVWVRGSLGDTHFVLGKAVKQHCVPTKTLAIQDLVARKTVHATMAQKRADRAKLHLEAAKQTLKTLEMEKRNEH